MRDVSSFLVSLKEGYVFISWYFQVEIVVGAPPVVTPVPLSRKVDPLTGFTINGESKFFSWDLSFFSPLSPRDHVT
jgi:hypothetical protein